MIIFVAVRQSRMKYCSVSHALVQVLRMDHCTEVVYSYMRLFSLSVTLTLPLTALIPAQQHTKRQTLTHTRLCFCAGRQTHGGIHSNELKLTLKHFVDLLLISARKLCHSGSVCVCMCGCSLREMGGYRSHTR